MRIVHVVEPFASGVRTFILTLVNGMPNEEHIVIYGLRDEHDTIEELGKGFSSNTQFIFWQHVARELDLFSDFRAYFFLQDKLNELQPDIVHLHSSKAGTLGRIYGAFHRKCKIIYTPNAIAFLRNDVGILKKLVFVSIEKLMSLLPGIVVSSSDGELQRLKEYRISARKIYNGAEVVEKISALNKEKIVIATCGRITTQKAPDLFLSFVHSLQSIRNIEFVWIGDGELRQQLDENFIRVTGWIQPEEVMQEIANCDIYVSFAHWEGLSLASIEAMAYRKPMILSNACGNTNLVEQHQNGWIINSVEEAVEKCLLLISDDKKRTEMGNYSRKRYETNFTAAICASNYLDLYYE